MITDAPVRTAVEARGGRNSSGITQGSVGVSTVSDTQHHDFVLLIVDAEHDSKRATARGPESVEVAVERCSNSARCINERTRDQLDDG